MTETFVNGAKGRGGLKITCIFSMINLKNVIDPLHSDYRGKSRLCLESYHKQLTVAFLYELDYVQDLVYHVS